MRTNYLLFCLLDILVTPFLCAQSFSSPTIDLGDANIEPGETVCLDLTAHNLQQMDELQYHFTWKWEHLIFREVMYNGAMIADETFVEAYGPRDEEASLTVRWQGNNAITGDTLLLQLCFEGSSPGRSSVEYYGTGGFDSLINLVSGFVNVGNIPRKIQEHRFEQSDFTVTDRMSFEIDPLRVPDLSSVSAYSFDLIYDTTLLALDLDNFYFGTHSRSDRRIEPLENGYRIIWPTNTHGTSNYQAIFPYRVFFKSKEVIDTTAWIYADNFQIVNDSRDSFQISSDTAIVYITDRIRRKTPVRVVSSTQSIPVDETRQVSLFIDEPVQLKSIDLELWNGREYEILDVVSSKLIQNGQFRVTKKGDKTRVIWESDSPVSFVKGDTLLVLEVLMNDYETGEEIPMTGAEFVNAADERMPLSHFPQATVKTPGYPSKEIDLTSDYIWASPGDTIRVHSSLMNDEELFEFLRSFKYDYYWNNLVLSRP